MISITCSGKPVITASLSASVDLPPPALPKTATLFMWCLHRRFAPSLALCDEITSTKQSSATPAISGRSESVGASGWCLSLLAHCCPTRTSQPVGPESSVELPWPPYSRPPFTLNPVEEQTARSGHALPCTPLGGPAFWQAPPPEPSGFFLIRTSQQWIGWLDSPSAAGPCRAQPCPTQPARQSVREAMCLCSDRAFLPAQSGAGDDPPSWLKAVTKPARASRMTAARPSPQSSAGGFQ